MQRLTLVVDDGSDGGAGTGTRILEPCVGILLTALQVVSHHYQMRISEDLQYPKLLLLDSWYVTRDGDFVVGKTKTPTDAKPKDAEDVLNFSLANFLVSLNFLQPPNKHAASLVLRAPTHPRCG